MYAQSLPPNDAQVAAFAIGRWEFPTLAVAGSLAVTRALGMEDMCTSAKAD